MKRIVSILLALALFAAGAAFAEGASDDAVAFAMEVTQTIADMGDNPDVGNRSSGSPAEREAAAYIEQTMKDIGLQNVTVDPFTADGWTFSRGRVYYEGSAEGAYFPLGGFATDFRADMLPVTIVDAGRGTAADYEGLDVEGKVVLIDIDQAEDWWIEIPTYEAHLRGALCVLACNVSGYAYYDADTLGSQDICGPHDAPVFSVSQNSAALLRELMAENGGEAEVLLDADSTVTLDAQSQNVWGEIPGATDEVIYFIAHYDGYYHSYFDDASGVGTMLAVARELANRGAQPDKTIRFVAHGAEEWGNADTEYDWGAGAYAQIMRVHPEWAEKGFAMLNIDGMYPVEGHTAFAVAATYELGAFAAAHTGEAFADGAYELHVETPTTAWTEDFSYVRAGIPAIVASHATPEEVYHGPAYHSSMDNVILGVDEAAWAETIELFTGYALALDALACRPLDFAARFEAMADGYAGNADVESVCAAADALNARIDGLNADYAAAVAAGDAETAAQLREEGMALNTEAQKIFIDAVAATTALDWEDNTVFPFTQTDANIEALEGAIASLEAGDAATALDEYLYAVDYNWYAYDFSQETYAYMLDKMYNKAEGTWGEGMIRRPGEDLYDVIHALMEKAEAEGADFSEELSALNAALERQNAYAAEIDAQLCAEIDALRARIEALA